MNMMSTLEHFQWRTGCVLISLSGRSGTNSIHRALTTTPEFQHRYNNFIVGAADLMNEPHSLLDTVEPRVGTQCSCRTAAHPTFSKLDSMPTRGMIIKELDFWCLQDCRLWDYRGTTVILQDRRSLHDHVFSTVIADAQGIWDYNGAVSSVQLCPQKIQHATQRLAQKKVDFASRLTAAPLHYFYEDTLDELAGYNTNPRNLNYSASVENWKLSQQVYWQTVEQHHLREAMINTGYATVDSLRSITQHQ